MERKHNVKLTPSAKELRKNMTKQERHLWYDFLRSYKIRILRQKIINNFIVDFYCASAKLVIELDGGHHCTDDVKAYDEERTKILNAHGLKVIRFGNHDVDANFEGVCQTIDDEIRRRCNNVIPLPSSDDIPL